MLSLLNTTFTNTLRQGSTLIGSLLSKLKARSTYFENKACTKTTLEELNSAGLLKKASIITTPTAYSNGFIRSVKPEPTLGSEKISNGDFSNGSTGWSPESGGLWTFPTGLNIARSNGSNLASAELKQNQTMQPGKKYQLIYEIKEWQSGTIRGSTGAANSGDGIYTEIITNNTRTTLPFTPLAFVGAITNVSLKEVTDADFTFIRNSPATRVNSQGLVESVQILGSNVVTNGDFSQIGSELITNGDFSNGSTDWVLTTPWSISDEKAFYDFSTSGFLRQFSVFNGVIGTVYRINFDVSNTTGIRLGITAGNTTIDQRVYTTGSYSLTLPVLSTDTDLRIYGQFSSGSISNISVVEIIDWAAGDGWSFGGNKASCDGTQTDVTNLIQAISTNIQNQLVKISFTLDISAGTLSGSLNNSGDTEFDALTTSGNYSVEATSSDVNPNIVFQGNADFVGSISNVVIEPATNDTDLPRINYENGCGSWLLEPQSINLFLNSETLSTQNVTTGSSTYTVSFYGTGSVVFTGTHIETLNGTGLNDRVTTTFTSTSGTLTCTVTGSVKLAQLEQKAFATSYIPTSGSPQTRAHDSATNAGNSDLISSTEGVLYAEIAALADVGYDRMISLSDGSNSNNLRIELDSTSNRFRAAYKNTIASGVSQSVALQFDLTDVTQFFKIAVLYNQNDFKLYINGVLRDSVAMSIPILPSNTFDGLRLTRGGISFRFEGKIKCLAVFKETLTDAELGALTTINISKVFSQRVLSDGGIIESLECVTI